MGQPTDTGRRFAAASILSLGVGALLAGCIVAPMHPRRSAPEYGYEDDGVNMPPPAPRYEVVGVAPHPGWFWIAGFWTWHLGRHSWVGGHWEAPRHGHRWQPHRWEPVSGGRWRERPGRWN